MGPSVAWWATAGIRGHARASVEAKVPALRNLTVPTVPPSGAVAHAAVPTQTLVQAAAGTVLSTLNEVVFIVVVSHAMLLLVLMLLLLVVVVLVAPLVVPRGSLA